MTVPATMPNQAENALQPVPANLAEIVPTAARLVHARVKWFDSARGFGFLVSEEVEGDILVHFSLLRDHGRRSLPEGAACECTIEQHERGLQAVKIVSIDLSEAHVIRPPLHMAPRERPDRAALLDTAGPFEPVVVKWFNRAKGYGFLNRVDDLLTDIFVHMETVRRVAQWELQPGQTLNARIAEGAKGLTAVELQVAE